MNNRLFHGQHDALDALQLFDAALHLLGLGGLRAKAGDEGFKMLDLLLLITIVRFELRASFGLLHQIFFVVAAIDMQPAIPDFDGFINGDIQKISVVRDQHKGVRKVP